MTTPIPPTEHVGHGIWSIPVPLPSSLRYVCVYAIELRKGIALVDAGWASEPAREALTVGLATLGATLEDIQAVLLTHGHSDHHGLLPEIRASSDAWTAMHPADLVRDAERLWGDSTVAHDWLLTLGVPLEERDAIIPALQAIAHLAKPPAVDRLLSDGDALDLGGRTLITLCTPGHSPGHVCYVERQSRVLFSGDHILSLTTPNISAQSRTSSALSDYLTSLERVTTFTDFIALPGHEERVEPVPRAHELIAHHEQQLSSARNIVANGRQTVRAIAEAMDWTVPWEKLRPLDRYLALAETLAHLLVLEGRGELTCDDSAWQSWQFRA